MRIVAVVGVKDEVEIIEQSIAHLRRIGVDDIVVCDMGSTDGTIDVLEAHCPDEDFRLVQMDDRDSHETWVRHTLTLVSEANADWAVFLDADEFPIAASGSLKDCASLATADAVTLDRYNVPLSPGGPLVPEELVPSRYDDLLLVAEPIRNFWSHLESNPETSWMRGRVSPRVIARPRHIKSLDLGAHNIIPSNSALVRRTTAADVVVAHLPFTGWSRFARKVDNIRKIFSVHDELYGDTSALHWRRWTAQAERGCLHEEFDRMVFDSDTIAELREQSVILSAAELFQSRVATDGAA